jgi:hypothetical protein
MVSRSEVVLKVLKRRFTIAVLAARADPMRFPMF